MKMHSIMLLFVAGLCGLVAMFGVQQALSQKPESGEQMVRVMQAAVEIQPGDQLNEMNTQIIEVNAKACPVGAVTELSQIEQRSLRVPAMPGDWILVSKLTEKGETGPAANVPKGMRGLTIPVDATQTHSGMLRPGNRVDIQLTFDSGCGQTRHKVARTILQYVEVFAVDDRVYGNDKSGDGTAMAKNISVLVTPEQSNMLCLARSMGTLSTTLRSNGDKEEVSGIEVSDDIFGNSSGETNIDTPSVMDVRRSSADDQVPVLFEDTSPVPAAEQLQAELNRGTKADPGGSYPTMQLAQADVPKNTWTMEIYEGGSVRLESVELPDETESVATDAGGKSGFWSFLGMKPSQSP
jgi:pilus assembly protein CpaB